MKEEIKFLYHHFIDDHNTFEVLNVWAKPLIGIGWFLRSCLITCLIIMLFPLFDLYYLKYEDIERSKNEVMTSYYLIMEEVFKDFNNIK